MHETILTLDGTSGQSSFPYPSNASSPQAKSWCALMRGCIWRGAGDCPLKERLPSCYW